MADEMPSVRTWDMWFTLCEDRLLQACKDCDLDEAKAAIDAGATNVDYALEISASNGNIPLIQLMVANGAESLDSALSLAARHGQRHAVRELFTLGATEWYDALINATLYGQRDTVELLVEGRQVRWHSLVKRAAKFGHVAVADLLIHEAKEAGHALTKAQLNFALKYACASKYEEMARLLVARGAVDIFSGDQADVQVMPRQSSSRLSCCRETYGAIALAISCVGILLHIITSIVA